MSACETSPRYPDRSKIDFASRGSRATLWFMILVFFSIWLRAELTVYAKRIHSRDRGTPDPRVAIGKAGDFPRVGVYGQHRTLSGFWVVHLPGNKLVAVRSCCPHDAGMVDWHPDAGEFRCQEFGCRFSVAGESLKGPARKPLERYQIGYAPDAATIVVNKSRAFLGQLAEWDHPKASVEVIPSIILSLGQDEAADSF